MKRLAAFCLFICFFICSQAKVVGDSALLLLYKTMLDKDSFMLEKELKIVEIKKMFETPNLRDEQRYDINLKLYNEYKTYISDSAIHYTKKNIEIAQKLNVPVWRNESQLDLVSLYIIAGMYIESINLLETIEKKELPDWLLVRYYDCYKQLFNYYSSNNIYTKIYNEQSKKYRDSLLSILDKESNHYKIVLADKLNDELNLGEAEKILIHLLSQTKSDTHEKAVLSYALADIYMKKGEIDLQKHYLAISALCDIKNAIKENAAMQALASLLFETGDVEKAYFCIKSSMEDAMFCNARLRTYEVSQIFPIIDTAYQENINKKKAELQIFLFSVTLLSLFLLLAIIYVYLQMRKVARIRGKLIETNSRLLDLNDNLQSTIAKLNKANSELNVVNDELSEANKIKEAYIGHFLDLCSTYINKLEKFQNTLNKKASDKKLDELYKMLKSKEMIERELKELYENFDKIFLHLYPNFIEEFNALLLPEEHFTLKTNELLNAELRIFALIRLGITDSSKIASFLHYSANTIYSYRTRVRNKAAVPRDEFEDLVMRIGNVTK